MSWVASVSVCQSFPVYALTFESPGIETSFLVDNCIFRISRSSGQGQLGRKFNSTRLITHCTKRNSTADSERCTDCHIIGALYTRVLFD